MEQAATGATEAGDELAAGELEMAADEAILACGGDAREAVKALILANALLEDQLSKVSYGYDRGRAWKRQAN